MTISVDGTTYGVPILEVDDFLEFLDKFAERTEDGTLRRELIGTFPKQRIVFATPRNQADRQEQALLHAKLAEPEEFHTVIIPFEDGAPYSFSAYVSGLSRKLRKWDDTVTRWGGLTVTFTAQSPKATP